MPAQQRDETTGNWMLAQLPHRLRTLILRCAGPAATLVSSLGAFAFFAVQGILLARMLGPEMRGAFAAAVLFPQALLYLGLLGAPELFALHAARGCDDTRLRRSAARYGLLAGLVTVVSCLLLDLVLMRQEFRAVMPLAFLCAMALPFQQIRLSVAAVDHGQRHMSRYNQGRILAAAAFPIALLIAWLFQATSLNTICWLFVLSQVATLALAARGMRGSWTGPGALPVSQALGEAKPLIAAWFASELLERIDMCLMLALVSDQATLGYYAAALPIAALLIIVPNAASLYAFNLGARSHEIPSLKTVGRMLGLGLLIQLICACALAALLPIVVPLFYGPKFEPTITFAWLLLPAGMFRGLLQAIDGYLRARGKAIISVVVRMFGTAILIIIATSTSRWWDGWQLSRAYAIPVGLSVALACCFIVMSGVMLVDVWRHHRPETPDDQQDTQHLLHS